MKKIIALALSVLMIMTCFVGCKSKKNEDLLNAVAYLENMYQEGSKDEPMVIGVDKDVLTVVTVDGVSYTVEWAVTVTEGASDAVVISESDTENCVKIDIPDLPESDILFTATATVKDEKDNSEVAEFLFKVNGIEVDNSAEVEAILNSAYALEDGATMEEEVTLTGKITAVDTAYSSQYKNITVTIVMDGFDDKPIKCYRLAGDGADKLAVGDTITVTGKITNYQGTIEFEQGCALKAVVKADADNSTTGGTTTGGTTTGGTTTGGTTTGGTTTGGTTTGGTTTGGTTTNTSLKLVTDQSKILNDAFALGKNATTPYIAQLEGKVISVTKEYNEQYGSVTVIMSVGGKNITCYNMKVSSVSGGSKVKAGDTITVRGVIKNFYYDEADTSGTVEFTWDDASQTEVTLVSLVVGQTSNKTYTVVDNPVVGTAYKFGMVQELLNDGKVYYLAGGMAQTYYLATTNTADAAIDVYLENADGGYYLYTTASGAKQYINMKVNGTHVNGAYESTASTVYTFNSESKTLTAKIDGVEYHFGTRNDKNYTTVGPNNVEYNGFYCKFYQ